jgi:hypothetical protein
MRDRKGGEGEKIDNSRELAMMSIWRTEKIKACQLMIKNASDVTLESDQIPVNNN